MLLSSSNSPQVNREYIFGDLIYVVHVETTNVVRDMRENIKNLTGGRLTHYEALIDKTVERAFDKIRVKIENLGYSGACSVRICNPSVVDGGCEVVIYATPYKFLE